MKLFLLLVLVVLAAGCTTDSQGRKESAWEALKRWDQSMNDTESRLQSKKYHD